MPAHTRESGLEERSKSCADSPPTPARIGIFSTLTSEGSRKLVQRVLHACRSGEIPGVEPSFIFVEREEGEFPTTDASVEAIRQTYGIPIHRASAIRFERDRRKAARESGDEAALWSWREAYYQSYAETLPSTDLDLLLGSMWIWGGRQCKERKGVNLHPSLPTGPLGKMWYDVVWDLVAMDAHHSGVMLHRVTDEVDEGPIVSYCRYALRGPSLDPLWARLPDDPAEREALIERERALKRETEHPLFKAIRATGYARELPLMLETVRAVAEGRLRLEGGGVVDAARRPIEGGLDLSEDVAGSLA
jgi:phosphoribosylglycinamide formyltransferase-1